MSNRFQNIFHQNETDKKPRRVSISGRELVVGSYNSHDINSANLTPKVNFLKGCAKSLHIDHIKFTNMLPSIADGEALDSRTDYCFSCLADNQDIVANDYGPIRHSGVNKDRIEIILSEQIGEEKFNELKGLFYKSDIENQLNKTKANKIDRGSFRVISVYEIEPIKHKKQKKAKHYLNVILIDPFHLFTPTGVLTENNIYIEKTKVHDKTYSLHKNNQKHIHEYYMSEYR